MVEGGFKRPNFSVSEASQTVTMDKRDGKQSSLRRPDTLPYSGETVGDSQRQADSFMQSVLTIFAGPGRGSRQVLDAFASRVGQVPNKR